jgi:hypothetical protein
VTATAPRQSIGFRRLAAQCRSWNLADNTQGRSAPLTELTGGSGFGRLKWVLPAGYNQVRFLRVGPPKWVRLVTRLEALSAGRIPPRRGGSGVRSGPDSEGQRPSVIRLPGHSLESFGQRVVAVLGAGDFDIAIAGACRTHGGDGSPVVVEGEVEAVGEQAGLETGGAEHRLLREGHALNGEQLGVDRLVDGGEVGFEMGDFVEIFEPDDGEGGSGEAVRAGIAGAAGLAFGGAWAGAVRGVGTIGGELFFGDGHAKGLLLLFEEIAWGGGRLCDLADQVAGKKGTYFFGQGVTMPAMPGPTDRYNEG